LTPENWDNGFRTQIGQNINVAANGIAKLLRRKTIESSIPRPVQDIEGMLC
jgi:hypothetical protein